MTTAQINIINNSENDRLHIAVYQKSEGGYPSPIAWRVVSLCKGSTAYVPTPDCYAVQVHYEREGVNYRTKCAPITDYKGIFNITAEEKCVKVTEATEAPEDNRIIVTEDANVGFSTGAYVVLGGDPLFGPAWVPPGGRVQFGIRPYMFFLAKIGSALDNGSSLDMEQVTGSEIPVRPNQTVTITGNDEEGYKMAVREGLYWEECGC